jgi:hypothetical protein
MKNRIVELVIGILTVIVSWLSLSYIFFPIKLSAPFWEYFVTTISHMIPLKLFITIVFVLVAIMITDKVLRKYKL